MLNNERMSEDSLRSTHNKNKAIVMALAIGIVAGVFLGRKAKSDSPPTPPNETACKEWAAGFVTKWSQSSNMKGELKPDQYADVTWYANEFCECGPSPAFCTLTVLQDPKDKNWKGRLIPHPADPSQLTKFVCTVH